MIRQTLFTFLLIACNNAEPPTETEPTGRSVTAHPNQARSCLRTKTLHSQLKKWSVRARFTQSLEAGQVHKEPMQVLDGVAYRIDSCGDGGVIDAGLTITDENGDIVAQSSGSKEPLVEFGPGDWGALEIVLEQRVLQAAGTGAVAVAVQYRSVEDSE
jgi:hypothetical protein